MEPFLLPDTLDYDDRLRSRLARQYAGGILTDPAVRIADVAATDYGIDLRARYGPFELPHPVGKASGQLSLQPRQIQADAEAGLAFVVLKTVIAEDPSGTASMSAWKVKKPRMIVEEIEGRRTPRKGWTVSWAGRGWEGSLESYLEFMAEAIALGKAAGMPVIPSCKYNLPSDEQLGFLEPEYRHTTGCFQSVWAASRIAEPLTLEQDFSPTLAGTDAAQSKRLILRWLGQSPRLIKKHAPSACLGVKLMNAVFDDDFQMEMMRAVSARDGAADFLVCFNRLFDPDRPFEDRRGIAYGGPDLSDRNLAMLRRSISDPAMERKLSISATGDILTGRMMVEYGLRGAGSGQLHTLFQLPINHFSLKGASRTRAALHELYFHPEQGILAAMLHLKRHGADESRSLAFMSLGEMGRRMILGG